MRHKPKVIISGKTIVTDLHPDPDVLIDGELQYRIQRCIPKPKNPPKTVAKRHLTPLRIPAIDFLVQGLERMVEMEHSELDKDWYVKYAKHLLKHHKEVNKKCTSV